VQEDERQKISHQLQDGIAQTLLGINVRLLALKTAAKGNTANLKKDIASILRLDDNRQNGWHRRLALSCSATPANTLSSHP
jgi:Histidine kinase.